MQPNWLSCNVYCIFSVLSLDLYFSSVSLSFPLRGMCSFVQSELDDLLPGGERLMVLLSSYSEMDPSTKVRM